MNVYIFILSTKLIQKNQNTYVDKQKTIFFLMKKTENKIFTAWIVIFTQDFDSHSGIIFWLPNFIQLYA